MPCPPLLASRRERDYIWVSNNQQKESGALQWSFEASTSKCKEERACGSAITGRRCFAVTVEREKSTIHNIEAMRQNIQYMQRY
jgi:hypothetical protein